MLNIRRFRSEDAQEVAAVVAQTLRISNRADYSQAYLEASIQRMNPAFFIKKAKQTHFYLVCEGDKIVGTGAIGPYWGSETEFSFFDIFVLPAYQKRGIGKLMIQTLEHDPYFKKAHRVEIPASITAVNFYRHMGYAFKNGVQWWMINSFIDWKSFRSGINTVLCELKLVSVGVSVKGRI